MARLMAHRWAQLGAVVIVLLVALAAWQWVTLRIAHSSFENYAAFRGCEQITSRSETTGTCTLSSGETITMVEFNGKWYLKGDLPVCWGNLCL